MLACQPCSLWVLALNLLRIWLKPMAIRPGFRPQHSGGFLSHHAHSSWSQQSAVSSQQCDEAGQVQKRDLGASVSVPPQDVPATRPLNNAAVAADLLRPERVLNAHARYRKDSAPDAMAKGACRATSTHSMMTR